MNVGTAPRPYLKSKMRLVVWCKACRHQMEMDFWMTRRGDAPLINLEFRCTQCRSMRTEWVVSGRDLLPKAAEARTG